MAKINNRPNMANNGFSPMSKTSFQVLMVVCMAYIITNKKLAFSIGEEGDDTKSMALFASERNDIDKKTTKVLKASYEKKMPVSDKQIGKKVAEKTVEKVSEKSIEKSVEKKNLANQFHNIAFILDANTAERYGVSLEVARQKQKICYDYVKKYAPIAKVEQQKFGIPVSITLAQGLLESDAGESRLSRSAVNHFGIKCFSHHCKKGHCKNFTDDTHKDFFVVYQNAWQSFRAHSEFLKQNRYHTLFHLGQKDYKSWARGLKKAGYATDKNYDAKLIRIIEAMQLTRFD
jgi:flagellum-specific peptidoglycan hydrolase FlgJ